MADKTLKYLESKFESHYNSLVSELDSLKRNKRDAETYLNELLKLIEIRKEIDLLTKYNIKYKKEYISDFFNVLEDCSELLIRLQDLNNQLI